MIDLIRRGSTSALIRSWGLIVIGVAEPDQPQPEQIARPRHSPAMAMAIRASQTGARRPPLARVRVLGLPRPKAQAKADHQKVDGPDRGSERLTESSATLSQLGA